MREPLAGWVIALVVVGGIVIPTVTWLFVWRMRGQRLLKRVRTARPGCVAFAVDPVPGTRQPELERLTRGAPLPGRLVISAEATGVSIWSDVSDEPIAEIPWSSVESTGMGHYAVSGGYGRTLAFNLTGGGTIQFIVPGPRLPLDVLHDMEKTREA